MWNTRDDWISGAQINNIRIFFINGDITDCEERGIIKYRFPSITAINGLVGTTNCKSQINDIITIGMDCDGRDTTIADFQALLTAILFQSQRF